MNLPAHKTKIVATIGPCIAQASYEVDEAFRDRFTTARQANARFFAAGRPGHHSFDLEGYVASRLADAGITQVERLGLDTYADADRLLRSGADPNAPSRMRAGIVDLHTHMLTPLEAATGAVRNAAP